MNAIIPLNEPYELYMTEKWGSFFDYIKKGDDFKLAKSTLRLLYSLLAVDDGVFRDSYEEIVRDAPLINMGRLFAFFGVKDYQRLLNKLLEVKKGNARFTDEERMTVEGFFTILSGFMDNYATSTNLLDNPHVKERIHHYLINKIKLYGGIDSIVEFFNNKLLNKNYQEVVIYVNDLLPFLNREKHKQFLENLVKMYDELLSDKLPKEFHLSNYYKIKNILGALTQEEVDAAISSLGKNVSEHSVYIARGIDRKEIYILNLMSDLYYYKLKLNAYEKEERDDLIKKMLIADPLNINKVLIAMKVYGIDYGVNNERAITFLVHDKEREFPELYRNLILSSIDAKSKLEIKAIDEHVEYRKKVDPSPEIPPDNWISKNGGVIEEASNEIKVGILSSSSKIKEKIMKLFDGRYINVYEKLNEYFFNLSEDIFKAELNLMTLLGVEHKGVLNATRVE